MSALPTHPEMNDLRMSDKARPLYEQVLAFLKDEVEPASARFESLHDARPGPWEWHPEQLEILDGLKGKARAAGLWNFFLPDAETGEGLSNLDYAYIASELGKYRIASESLNCSAPDTGNMEVLERVGTAEQKKQWLEPLLAGEIRSAYIMTEPDLASSDAKNISCRAVLDGDEWVINGEKYFSSGAGDPRCKILIVMVKTNDGGSPTSVSRKSWFRWTRPASKRSARCTSSAKTTRRTVTCTCASTIAGCPARTFCSARAGASRSPSFASAPVESITACVRSAPRRRPSN